MNAPDRALARALRLVLVTDGRGDAARLCRLVAAAVDGGLRTVQLREPALPAADYASLCERLAAILRAVGGVLLLNDRVAAARAEVAAGVHLGARSMPVAEARARLGPAAWIGFSAHDAAEIASAAAQGADYVSLSPVWPTTCKPGAPALGLPAALRIAQRAPLPVVLLGGIDERRAAELRGRWSGGVAVRSAICEAADPRPATAALRAALGLDREVAEPR